MEFALTTHWNAGRHTSGEAMLEEILALGFRHVELGYDLRLDLVPGVQKMVRERAVAVDSVHNYCPLPVTAPSGHPELYTLASPERRIREQAVHHTGNTIRFAAELGASTVVAHAGNVHMKRRSPALFALYEQGQQYSVRYEKIRLKLQTQRESKVRKQLGFLYEGLERLLPLLEEVHVRLALENLPTWEAIPTELEMEALLNHFGSKQLAYWHDIGHGQIRQNMGFISQERWLERLGPRLAGMHLHDVRAPAYDHLMPPSGDIDFARYREFGSMRILRVMEPMPRTPPEHILQGLKHIQEAWGEPPAGANRPGPHRKDGG